LDEPEEYIDFMAKYKDWIAIRRLGIRADTRPEEVVMHMAGVRTLIDSKSYPMLGIKVGILDEYANKLTNGARKSYATLGKAIESLSASETKSIIDSACENKALTPIAEVYLLSKTITNLGYDTGINPAQMAKIFPGLKMPKVPMGRKKKAAVESPQQ
jgi:Protein of unknown function (DUF2666)